MVQAISADAEAECDHPGKMVRVLWIGLGHRIATCVEVPVAWLAAYRARVVGEWRGKVLGVYRPRVKSRVIANQVQFAPLSLESAVPK